MSYPNAIRDCLANLSLRLNNNKIIESDSISYYRGLVVGVLSTLMLDKSYRDSIKIIKDNLPNDCIDLSLLELYYDELLD